MRPKRTPKAQPKPKVEKEKQEDVVTWECAYIEWEDAVADSGWEETKKPEIHKCQTLGFIVAEDKDAICVAAAVSKKESNAKINIPKGWIQKIKRFKVEGLG
jgi:hypothetical protein